MTFVTHIFRHSKQLINAPGLIQQDHVILVRRFTLSARFITGKGEDVSKLRNINNVSGENICVCKSCSGSMSSTPLFTRSYRAVNPTKVLRVAAEISGCLVPEPVYMVED